LKICNEQSNLSKTNPTAPPQKPAGIFIIEVIPASFRASMGVWQLFF